MFATILSLILFAIFMTGSPGPGNLLMMAGGASLNFKKCTYFLIGLVAGKTLVNFLIFLGLGAIVINNNIIFEVLKYLKEKGVNRTKSGIMLGLGETEKEIYETLNDLIQAKVDIVTMGQYLQPTKDHLPVSSFITPDDFKKYENYALSLGFRHVESGPLVRSSYKAHKHVT